MVGSLIQRVFPFELVPVAMMKLLLWLAALIAVSAELHSKRRYRRPAPDGETHALIVAGSDGWYNYRHQADACHAYHTLRNHGVPEENIVVMMYDDIAHNKQ
ncbi:unnamed protein product [Strongylus vulgaris]|uniref:Peptidase C13 family protein n=1 Tax=Strongylus vulgaris TaxID=40348 RepID=A0A3P7JC77_STRVU|nr:unnamed protein product [Strongylus vulgaris]